MLFNHLIFALRLLRRDKFHSILNIIGLSAGFACSIIILLYLQNELTYDTHHINADRIYRAAVKYTYSGQTTLWASSSPALGRRLKDEFPETFGLEKFMGKVFGFIQKNHPPLPESYDVDFEPMLIRMQQNIGGSLIVRFNGANTVKVMDLLENKWKAVSSGRPFVYSFLDEEFDRLYDADRQQNRLITIFSHICILISCLGLLGLSSFNTSRRTKEIAIRKAYGASSSVIITMLLKEVFWLVTAASAIAAPIAIILIKVWLQNFAYRTDVDILMFVVTAIMALIIAFLATSCHCRRVASANPLDSLRYE
jgi:hypothetical protein